MKTHQMWTSFRIALLGFWKSYFYGMPLAWLGFHVTLSRKRYPEQLWRHRENFLPFRGPVERLFVAQVGPTDVRGDLHVPRFRWKGETRRLRSEAFCHMEKSVRLNDNTSNRTRCTLVCGLNEG